MITLRPVTEENYGAVLKLTASEDLVAPNYMSLAQAYNSLREAVDEDKLEYALMPFAILHEETVVGFTMIGFEDGEDVNAGGDIFWMSRFMIDDIHQRKGYGKAAMLKLIDFIKTKPNGCDAKYFFTSVVPGYVGSVKTYESVGFTKTGEMFHDEELMRLEL